MGLGEIISATIHIVFAGLWTGSVMFIALVGMPKDGIYRFQWISRISAILLVLTGAHLATVRFPENAFTTSGRGWAVIFMVILWFLLAAISEVAANRYEDGTANAMPLFRVGGVIATLLLIDAGILVGT
ncbi:MAG: hypothetical protein ABEI06_10080 [Halobacteriaceae archaeon]